MYLSGMDAPAIARELGVTKQAVYKHIKNHERPKIVAIKEAEFTALKDNWISDKTERLSRLQMLAEKTLAEVDEYGVVVVERVIETSKDGTKETVTETRDYRASLVRELRGLFSDAAAELGQRPSPPNITVNNDNRTQVLVRQLVDGSADMGLGELG